MQEREMKYNRFTRNRFTFEYTKILYTQGSFGSDII